MKYSAIVFIVVAFTMHCKDKEPVLSVAPLATDIVFSADGAVVTANGSPFDPTFKVETDDGSWHVTSDQKWLTAKKSGMEFTLSATINPEQSLRKAIVTVSSSRTAPIVIQVSQEGYVLSLSSTEDVNINNEGTVATSGTLEYTVTTNLPVWHAVSNQPWLTVVKSDKNFTLSATENGQLSVRKATVALMTGDFAPVFMLQVSQDGTVNIVPHPGGAGQYVQLVWHDEFDGNGLVDWRKWSYETGYIRNNEMQYYTIERPENTVLRDGCLVITARNDNALIAGEIRPVTSASLLTKGKGDWKYCRLEVRAKLPLCLGTFPAIWMVPTVGVYGDYLANGEIDIMEHVGYAPDRIHFNLHTFKYTNSKGTGRGKSIDFPQAYNNFHVYAIEWFEDRIDWFIDDAKLHSVQNDGTGWEAWPFDQPFYLRINFAFGGNWAAMNGIDLDGLPQEFVIDFVRVFQ